MFFWTRSLLVMRREDPLPRASAQPVRAGREDEEPEGLRERGVGDKVAERVPPREHGQSEHRRLDPEG